MIHNSKSSKLNFDSIKFSPLIVRNFKIFKEQVSQFELNNFNERNFSVNNNNNPSNIERKEKTDGQIISKISICSTRNNGLKFENKENFNINYYKDNAFAGIIISNHNSLNIKEERKFSKILLLDNVEDKLKLQEDQLTEDEKLEHEVIENKTKEKSKLNSKKAVTNLFTITKTNKNFDDDNILMNEDESSEEINQVLEKVDFFYKTLNLTRTKLKIFIDKGELKKYSIYNLTVRNLQIVRSSIFNESEEIELYNTFYEFYFEPNLKNLKLTHNISCNDSTYNHCRNERNRKIPDLQKEKLNLALFGFKLKIKDFQNFILNEELSLNLTLEEKETAEANFFNSLEFLIKKINFFLLSKDNHSAVNKKLLKSNVCHKKRISNRKKKKSRYTRYFKDDDQDDEYSSLNVLNKFDCKFCEKAFDTHQGLGGHMSRKHPLMSEKFKRKMNIRENRTLFRKLVYKARKILFSKLNFDYDQLKLNSKNNNFIKQVRKENNIIYQRILKTLKEDYNEYE